MFKNNDIAEVREVTETKLVLKDGRRMRRDGARIDQGVCITSYAGQCATVDQVAVLPDGSDAKGWYVSLSRAREAMHVYTRDKVALRQSVSQPGERKSVWELSHALGKLKLPSRDPVMLALLTARHAEGSGDGNGALNPLPSLFTLGMRKKLLCFAEEAVIPLSYACECPSTPTFNGFLEWNLRHTLFQGGPGSAAPGRNAQR